MTTDNVIAKHITCAADVRALFKTLNRDTKFYAVVNFDGAILGQPNQIYRDLYHTSVKFTRAEALRQLLVLAEQGQGTKEPAALSVRLREFKVYGRMNRKTNAWQPDRMAVNLWIG